ncbi:MAG: hypothetical protein QOE96_361 [Blastocatellia bacterium]|jgi:hypothetical protein|nr:hypothetical protein [Blastocatellia bacterium]
MLSAAGVSSVRRALPFPNKEVLGRIASRSSIHPALKSEGPMSLSTRVKFTLALLIIAFALFEPMVSEDQVSHTAFAESGGSVKSAEGAPLPAPGESTVRELAPGETAAYVITLTQHQYLGAVLERRDLDISLKLSNPVGGVLLQLECRNPV